MLLYTFPYFRVIGQASKLLFGEITDLGDCLLDLAYRTQKGLS